MRASVNMGQPKNRKPTKDIIYITDTARRKVDELYKDQPETHILRIGLKVKGCNGQSYHLEFVDKGKTDPLDEQIKTKTGNMILIHRRAQLSIIGSEMDYNTNRLHEGFVFTNPNIKGTCGCGESFNLDDINLAAGINIDVPLSSDK